MNLADLMDEIGDAVDTISTLNNIYRYPVDSVAPPAAIVQFPEIDFDAAFQRGTDRMNAGIAVVVSRVWNRAARDAIAAYCAGSGSESVHAAIKDFTWTECSFALVTRVRFPPEGYTVGGVPYVAAQFELAIAGPGS